MTSSDPTASEQPDPLLAGRVHGFRTWDLALDRDGRPGLVGYGETRWSGGGEPTRASCLPGDGSLPHPEGVGVPAPDCSCGLYANHPWGRDPNSDFCRVDGLGLEPDEVFGVVEAWGGLEVHAEGFRAEFARPIALFARTGAALEWDVPSERLAREYRAELIHVGSVEELASALTVFDLTLDRGFVDQLVGDRLAA